MINKIVCLLHHNYVVFAFKANAIKHCLSSKGKTILCKLYN